MDDEARQQAFMSALVTEHFVLQSAASATISESSSRTSVYLLSLSSSLVALGFASNTGGFTALAAAVLPTLFVLGWFTVVRLVDTSVENVDALRRIARIRQYYATLVPDAADYFPSRGDIAGDAEEMLGIRYTRFSLLFTLASMVGTVNAVLGGSGVALLLDAGLGLPSALAVAAGLVTGIACLIGVFLYQRNRFAGAFAASPT